MKITAAVTRDTFKRLAIVLVKRGTTMFRGQATQLIATLQPVFPGCEVVLFEQEFSGRGRFFGNHATVWRLSRVDPQRLPWREYWIR